MQLNLFEKTEIRITGIELANVNLTDVANTVADVLQLPRDRVAVIDVRSNCLALDVLLKEVNAENIFGKRAALFDALRKLPGICLGPAADIHSDGILGYIALDEADAIKVLDKTRSLMDTISNNKKGKVIVFATGFELIEKKICDTNTPYIIKRMEEAGYDVERGGIIPDDRDAAIEQLRKAAGNKSIIVTTGGVGAEDKDFMVEAVLELDPQAETPYIVKFKKGQGRHVKDGIRIAVGEYLGTLIIALPGPHHEVKAVIPSIIKKLKEKVTKAELAFVIKSILHQKMQGEHE